MHADRLFGNLEHPDALDPARRAGEVLVDGLAIDADRLEQLRAAVTHVGRHAHLRHDLGQPLADRFAIVVDRLVGTQLSWQAPVDVGQGLEREVGMHRFGAVSCQRSKMVHFARASSLDYQACRGTQPFAHQVLVHRAQRQQRRDRQLRRADGPVADDEDVLAAPYGVHRLRTQGRQFGFHTFVAPRQRVGDVERITTELAVRVPVDIVQLRHVGKTQDRLRDFKPHRRVDLVDVEQVGLGPDEGHQRHHDRLPDRIDRRIRDLCKQLLEVVVQRLVLV